MTRALKLARMEAEISMLNTKISNTHKLLDIASTQINDLEEELIKAQAETELYRAERNGLIKFIRVQGLNIASATYKIANAEQALFPAKDNAKYKHLKGHERRRLANNCLEESKLILEKLVRAAADIKMEYD